MGIPVTPCCGCPTWIDRALAKAAQFYEELDQDSQDPAEFRREVKQTMAAVPFCNLGVVVNPAEWGKKGKRPVALPQGVKNRAQKGVHAAVQGYHVSLPVEAIIAALAKQGLVPLDANGEKWQGMFVGDAACGTEEAKGQMVHLSLATKGPDEKWALTTTWLRVSYCKLPSGKYEVVGYLQ